MLHRQPTADTHLRLKGLGYTNWETNRRTYPSEGDDHVPIDFWQYLQGFFGLQTSDYDDDHIIWGE